MKTPEEIAAEIVDQFSWTTNVSRNGRLVGQQYIVAEAIAKAIADDRATWAPLHRALVDATMALHGLNAGRLKPNGRVGKAAAETAMSALQDARPLYRAYHRNAAEEK